MKNSLKLLFYLILPFTNVKVLAQTVNWNKMPAAEDIKMRVWEADTSAEAVVLNNQGLLFMEEFPKGMGFSFIEHKRIKILKKSAYDRANISIPYYHKNDWENISSIRAQIWLADGRKVAVDMKNVATEKLNDRWSVKKFTFPNVEEGAILEYEYELTSYNVLELREWFFQSDIPTRYSSFNLNVKSRFEYVYLFQGQDNLKSTKPEYKNDNTIVTFYVENLSGLKKEAFVSSMDNYRTRIRFQLSKYYQSNGVKNEVLSTWEKTARELWDEHDFGKRFTKKNNFDDAWNEISNQITEGDSAMSKIQKIYNFVNEKVIWDERFTWFSKQSLNEVFKKGKGTSGEINLLLISLLREAGLDANPVLMSTRQNGSPIEQYPILDQFNHVIVHVNLPDGRIILLEGGDKYRPMGILEVETLNKKGALLTKKEVKWIAIDTPLSTESYMTDLELKEDGTIEGSIKMALKGFGAVNNRKAYETDKDGKFIKTAWAKTFPEFGIKSLEINNKEAVNEPLKVNFHCLIPNAADAANDMLYLKLPIHTGWEQSPFKLVERTYPVDIPYATNEQFAINITIPEGFKVEEMPKQRNLVLPKEGGSFQYQINQIDNRISISIRIKIKQLFYTSGEYFFLKELFDDIAKKLQEPIVLKKV